MWSITLTVLLALTALIGSWTKNVKDPGEDRLPWYRRIRRRGIALALIVGALAMANAWVSSNSERTLQRFQEETLDNFYDDLSFRMAKFNADLIVDEVRSKITSMHGLLERSKNDASRATIVQMADLLTQAVQREIPNAIVRLKEEKLVFDEDNLNSLTTSLELSEGKIESMRDEAHNEATFALMVNAFLWGVKSDTDLFVIISRNSIASTYINSLNEVFFGFRPTTSAPSDGPNRWGAGALLLAGILGGGVGVGGIFVLRMTRRQSADPG